jgi:hypothetical protein
MLKAESVLAEMYEYVDNLHIFMYVQRDARSHTLQYTRRKNNKYKISEERAIFGFYLTAV